MVSANNPPNRILQSLSPSLNIDGKLSIDTGCLLLAAASTLTVGGNADIGNGQCGIDASAGGIIINVGGNWSNVGNNTIAGDIPERGFKAGDSTVVFTSDNTNKTMTIVNQHKPEFYNITFNGLGSWSLQDPLYLNNNLTITKGTLDAKGKDIELKGNWANNGGTFTASGSTVTLKGAGLQQVTTGGVNSAFSTLTIQNYSTNGVRFLDGLQTANLNATNGVKLLTFAAGATHTISANLNISGSGASSLLLLRSTSVGAQWKIDPQGARNVSYLDVQDSDNIASVIATNTSKDSGNDNNWNFSHHLTVGGIAVNQSTNTTNSVLVIIFDAYGNTSTSYTGTVHFSSTDPQATLPGNYTFTHADNGAHTFANAVQFATGGGHSVTVADILTGASGLQVNITVISPSQIDKIDKNIPTPEPPSPEFNADAAQSISLGDNLMNIPEDDALYKKKYAKGKYRTVVIVFEGRVVVSPYDEKGVKKEETVTLTGGQTTIKEGAVK